MLDLAFCVALGREPFTRRFVRVVVIAAAMSAGGVGSTQQGQPAQPFITPSVEEMTPQIPQIYRDEFGKRLEKLMAKKAKR